jgi:hypothetical protein
MSKKRAGNLGAGTQSSLLAAMADRGDIEPVDRWIFSDTQAEPLEVYDHLNWLAGVPYEKVDGDPPSWRAIPGMYTGGILRKSRVVVVTAGNLETDGIEFRSHRFTQGETGKRYASIPLFVLNPDGSQGVIRRQCTAEYKIEPITKYIRSEMLGLKKGEVYRGEDKIEQVFGISFDERHRAKNGNGDPKWMLRDYPLVDMKLTRWQVIAMAEKWFPDRTFPRSACVFCPYKSNEEWRRLRDDHPDEWTRAVRFDHAMRAADAVGIATGKRKLVGVPFVHRQNVPLDQADLRHDDEKQGQLTLTGLANECEGMCGV